jgi:predicted Zn-dependent protease
MRKDNTRAAILELTALLAQYHGDPNRLRSLGNVARRLPARELARKFAEAQFQLEPRNPEAILYLAQQLRMDGDRTRALELLSSLFHNERRAPFISDQQWVRLAQELYEVGEIALTKEAIAEVVAREPNNPLVRTVTATTALLEKFGEGASTGPSQEAVHEPVRQGLASRLARMLRR